MSPSPTILPASLAALQQAATRLRAGGLVAFPTETVYGLAADATQDEACARVFAAKQRPRFNPLILHLPALAAAASFGEIDDRARLLADLFWPGPLTMVLRQTAESRVSRLATAGLDTVAIRAPNHPVAQALLAETGRPLAAPSANPSGRISPTTPVHVADAFPTLDLPILAGGKCQIGLESTVIDLSDETPRLLRHGAITQARLVETLGEVEDLTNAETGQPRSPGQALRHYAPRLPLRLDVTAVGSDEALIAFGPDMLLSRQAAAVENLSEAGDLVQAAANLFAALHRLDDPRFSAIAVMPIPDQGLGVAINDRLRRACGLGVL